MKHILLVGLLFGHFAFAEATYDPIATLKKSHTLGDYLTAVEKNIDAKDVEFLRKMAGKGLTMPLKVTSQSKGKFLLTVGEASTSLVIDKGVNLWISNFIVNGKEIPTKIWAGPGELFEEIAIAIPHKSASMMDLILPAAVAQMTTRGTPDGYTPESLSASENVLAAWVQTLKYDYAEWDTCAYIRMVLKGCNHPNKNLISPSHLSSAYSVTFDDTTLKTFMNMRAGWGEVHSCRREDDLMKKCVNGRLGLKANPAPVAKEPGAVPEAE